MEPRGLVPGPPIFKSEPAAMDESQPPAAPQPNQPPEEIAAAASPPPPAQPVFVYVGDAPPAADWLGRNLYVRRLPPVNIATGEMPAETHVHALFSRFGEIERIKVIRDRISGLPVGSALVLFKDPAAAQLALKTINAANIGAVVTMWLPKNVLYAGAGAI